MPADRRGPRWVLRLLPPSFREEYEREILRTWQAEQRDAAREGGSFQRRAIADTLRIAPREHAIAFARNVRFAARQWRRAPGVTLAAVLTLALGTGATGAVFSLVNTVLLQPLPFRTPDVTGAAAISQLPLSGAMLGSTFLPASGREARRIDADFRTITPGYFGVVGTPVLAGRAFTEAGGAGAPAVAVVDAAFARRMDPSGAVIGKRVRWIRQPEVEVEIVGIVQPVRHRGPGETVRETLYRPLRQLPRASMFLVARTARDAAASAPTIRAALRQVDPSQPVADVATLEQRLARSVSRARTSLTIAGVLGGLALALGAIGLYGVLSFGVAQRRREFGVRLAIGATPGSVRARVLVEGLTLATGGIVLGVCGAAVVVRVLRSAFDASSAAHALPWLIGIATVLVASVAALWIPASRAGGVDPIVTLRSE